MSLLKGVLFLGSLMYFYKFLSNEEKANIKKTLLEKFNEYKPKIIEIINLLDSFNNDQITGIRNESNIDYKKKCADLLNVIDSFDDEKISQDLDDISASILSNKKNHSKNIKQKNNKIKQVNFKKTKANKKT